MMDGNLQGELDMNKDSEVGRPREDLQITRSVIRTPPGSSVHRILQARILEWVAIPLSRGSFQPRDWVFCIAGRFFTI